MEDNFITLKIDDKEVKAKEGTTILQAAKQVGIDIPTLCFLKDINEVGDCRMCIVEVEGRKGFATSCIQKVEEGMIVHTHSPAVMEARRVILDLILSNHHRDCLTCSRNGNCELQALAVKFNVQHVEFEGEMTSHKIDDKSPAIMRDFNKCILCRRCVAACKNVQEIGAIDCINRGFESCISTVGDNSLADVNCTFCGQCIEACPTGALKEKEYIKDVWRNLKNPEIYTVVQTAPAVRVALGEEFDMAVGTNVTGKMVSALKSLGFDRVFDTNTGADLTIMEEANEFIERFEKQEGLPMITSCSPGWVRFAEKNYPDLLGHLSSCKSPHQMFGAMVKSYYAKKYNVDPSKICMVSVMPCIAKKYECQREEMEVEGIRDVDYVITTRELSRMIKQANIEFTELQNDKFDEPMGEATGAGAIFGTTGGVMEAALRTAADVLENKDLPKFEYEAVRGGKERKEAVIEIAGKKVKAVVVSGLSNARKIMDEIKEGKADYQFVEIMACPGGCIMGGGQPIKSSKTRSEIDVRKLRADALYSIDEKSVIRKSHENPVIKQMYEDFLQKPGSEVSHKYLHTHYSKKELYDI
ncbi:MAG TPA: NADH-dependent [FeFe] hydrogenase, group A6 [Clostridiaceae bacterium]|jgi:NADP-reducing hydrogenase subunit HndD|nr:NADH-dependent [FeFe] hydrogenase, group A6 [Clostridiaceae bacterium]